MTSSLVLLESYVWYKAVGIYLNWWNLNFAILILLEKYKFIVKNCMIFPMLQAHINVSLYQKGINLCLLMKMKVRMKGSLTSRTCV